ncbi:hypothetical protein AZ34_12830, partial [Hylemonella gracilis str. Niagara R]
MSKMQRRNRSLDSGSTSPGFSDRVSLTRITPIALAAALALGGVALPLPLYAGPKGGTVVGGSGSVSRPDGTTTNVQQNSQRLALEWDSFNVGADERVNFYQPSSSAWVLNQILDGNASVIRGQINANGNVILVNGNGVYFGSTAQLSVGSLVASGLGLSTEGFMAGQLKFERHTGTSGRVVNRGVIQAATGGSVSLLGASVENSGTIIAKAGRIHLGVGERITLDFDGDGLMRFAVDEALQEQIDGLDTAILNSGELRAEGGQVVLEGRVARDVFAHVVNNEGVIKAGRIDNTGGVIRLVGFGGSASSVLNSGTLDAAGRDATSTGGQVHVLGERIALTGNALVDASGAKGGGEILIGGDYQGKNPEIPNADKVVVTSGVQIKADATEQGDGGKVIFWADDWTRFYGSVSARGGQNGGDGGFAEVSGKNQLAYSGTADLSASQGQTGTLLLDPEDINIVAGTGADDAALGDQQALFADGASGDFVIGADTINSQTANVILQATQDITQAAGADINIAASGVGITLQAGRHIDLQAGVTTNGGHIHLEADSQHSSDGPADGTGTLTIGGTGLTSGGGQITLIGADFDITQAVNAGSGNIDIAFSTNAAITLDVSSSLSIAEIDQFATTGLVRVGAATTAGANGAGGGVDLRANSITLAGDLTITGANGYQLSATDGIDLGGNAIDVGNSDLTLETTNSAAGDITGSGDITGGAVRLNAAGDITVTGTVNGDSVLLQADGDIGTGTSDRVTTNTNDLGIVAGGSAWVANTGSSAATLAGSAVGVFDVTHGGSNLTIESTTDADGAPVDGMSAGSISVSVTGGGDLRVNETIGADNGNVSLSANAITLAADVNSTGSQTYTGAVTLAADVTLTAKNGSNVRQLITFESTVDSEASNAHDLTLDGNGVFEGVVGSATNGELGALDILGTLNLQGDLSVASLGVAGASSLGGDVTTTGAQTYEGAVTLVTSTRTLTAGSGLLIDMQGGLTGNGFDLHIATGNWKLTGNATGLGSLSVDGASSLGGNVMTSGAQNYSGVVTLTGGMVLRTLTGTIIDFGDSVNASTAGQERLRVVGAASFSGAVGTGTALGSLEVTSTSSLGGNVTTTGTQTYTGAVTLTSDVALNTTHSAVTFSSTVNSQSSATNDLTVNTGSQTVSFGDAVGGGTNGALGTLTISNTSASGVALPAVTASALSISTNGSIT